MGVQGFAARSALVLRRALTERSPVRTGYADGHALAALQFRGVRRLIVVPRVRSYIIGITFLVVVELRESGVDQSEVRQGMAELLPQLFDSLTPNGDTRTEPEANDEISEILSQLSQFKR
jgi:hypothetical protein